MTDDETIENVETKMLNETTVECNWCAWKARHRADHPMAVDEMLEVVTFLRTELIAHCATLHADKGDV